MTDRPRQEGSLPL